MAKAKHKTRRRSNTVLKAARARSWARGHDRRELRGIAQEEAHRSNKALRRAGLPTAWESARAARRAARAADPEVQHRRHLHEIEAREEGST